MKRIKGLVRRDDTTVRVPLHSGGFPMTWAADDRQFVVGVDGLDLGDPPTRAYHSTIFTLSGDPPDPVFAELPGYPYMPMRLRESCS